MTIMRLWGFGLAALTLGACSAPGTETAPPAQTGAPAGEASGDAVVQPEWDALDRVGADTCGMRVVRGFLGELARDIPEDRLPPVHRILSPTDSATTDYMPARLNVLTDEDGLVIGFKCG